MMPLKVSIVMLAVNMERTFLAAAMTVLDYPLSQLVVVDPTSNPNISNEIDFLKLKYGQRVVFTNEKDKSPAEGLNHGIDLCVGEIIGVLNGDDFYLPGALTHVSNMFDEHKDLDILIGSGILLNEENHNAKFIFPYCQTKISNTLVPFGSVTFFHQGIFYKREKFAHIKFNINNLINWDYEHFVQMSRVSTKTLFSAVPLACFRINSKTISGSGKYGHLKAESHLAIARILGKETFYPSDKALAKLLRIFKFFRSLVYSFLTQVKNVGLK